MASATVSCSKPTHIEAVTNISAGGTDSESPRVLILWPHKDERGAFTDKALKRITDNCAGKVEYVVRKIKTNDELKAAIEDDSKTADVLMVCGHGRTLSTRLSATVLITSAEDFKGLSSRCKKIVLYSCSTGSHPVHSLAAKVAKMGKEVLAPIYDFYLSSDSKPNEYFDGYNSFPIHLNCGRVFKGESTPMSRTGYNVEATKEELKTLSEGDAHSIAENAQKYLLDGCLETAIDLIQHLFNRLSTAGDHRTSGAITGHELSDIYPYLLENGRIEEFTGMLSEALQYGSDDLIKDLIHAAISSKRFDVLDSVKDLPISDRRRTVVIKELFSSKEFEHGELFAKGTYTEEKWLAFAKEFTHCLDGHMVVHCLEHLIKKDTYREELLTEYMLGPFFEGSAKYLLKYPQVLRMVIEVSSRDGFDQRKAASNLRGYMEPHFDLYEPFKAMDIDGLTWNLQTRFGGLIQNEVSRRIRDGMEPMAAVRDTLVSQAETNSRIAKLLGVVWEMHGKDDRGEGLAFGPNHLFDSPFLLVLADKLARYKF